MPPPPPPPPAPSTGPPILIGDRVQVRGLRAKPEFNGQYGVVVNFVAETGRFEVKFKDGARWKLKPQNLGVDDRIMPSPEYGEPPPPPPLTSVQPSQPRTATRSN
jgi:hypothetical protein